MRQVILLESDDINAMKKGEHITLHAGGQTILLGLAKVRKEREPKQDKPTEFPCPKCDRVFTSKLGRSMHIQKLKGRSHGTETRAQVP